MSRTCMHTWPTLPHKTYKIRQVISACHSLQDMHKPAKTRMNVQCLECTHKPMPITCTYT